MSKFAAIQMCASSNIDENLSTAQVLIHEAYEKGAEFIALPEGFSLYGVDREKKIAHAERIGDGKVQNFLANMAQKYKVWLLGGTVLIKEHNQQYYISSLLYNSAGECIARYNKINLFKANLNHMRYAETDIASPGSDYVVVATPFGRVGFSVCFDLRFPALFQKLYQLGAEIIAVPSAFTYITGAAHWEVLLRARALDTFCYIVAPAQFGKHDNGYKTYGHSMIINPWGEIMERLTLPQNGIVIQNLDMREVYRCRNKIIK
jgi:predicted amidohydrolase